MGDMGNDVEEHLVMALPGPAPEGIVADLRQRFPDIKITWFSTRGLSFGAEDQNDMKELFKTVTILGTFSALPKKVEDAPHLQYLHLFSAGVEHIYKSPVYTDTDIPITTSSGVHGPPISEWIVASVLALTKHTLLTYEQQKAHHWAQRDEDFRAAVNNQTDWVGKTVGIAGYGGIGRNVARVFSAMGSRIHVYTASPRTTAEARKDDGYHVPGTGDPDGTVPAAWFSGKDKPSLHTFLRSGLDLLVTCLPLTQQTRHLFGTPEFQILRDGNPRAGCIFSNISRGAIVNQPDLVSALDDGTLAGAALDVADPEPLPPHDPLWDAKNCVLSPHVSGLGREYTGRAVDVLRVNLERRREGKGLLNEVHRGRGY